MAYKKRGYGQSSLLPWTTAKQPGEQEKRFIQLGNSLVLDERFSALSVGAKWLYVCMLLESGGKNEFPFSKGVARRKYKIAPSTYDRYRRELIEAGYIELMNNLANPEYMGQFSANRFRFSWEKWRSGTNRRPP